jgi:hypothetical protein
VVDRGGDLRTFDLPDLKPAQSLPLGCRGVVFGPQRVGNAVLLATDRDELVCVSAAGQELWRAPLEHGPLAGAAQDSSGNLVLASQRGVVWRAAADTGKELGLVDLVQPLVGNPVVAGQQVLVRTADGALIKGSLSATEAAP